jgi:predicted dienelactone hydrolase
MTIQSEQQTLFDAERGREIPLKIYHPKIEKAGVVIFSHGLGGSNESYKYYAEYLAAHGFMSIHPTHIGIDAALLKEKRPFQALKEAADIKENQANPARDIKFILDEMKLDNVVMAGHSFGSYTTLLLAGQDVSKKGFDVEFKDSRIKSAIAMSPHAVLQQPEHAYDEIKIPMLHITGKFDDSPFGFFEPVQRRIPFDNIKSPDQYLIIFNDADHMVFAAQRKGNKFSAKDIQVMKDTCAASLEFLKKYALHSDSMLDTPEFAARLTSHAIFERK